MSDERRKRQEQRSAEEPKSPKRTILYAAIAILFVGTFIAGRYYRNHKYDSFAQCVASRQAKMYGLYWCPHCIEQKEEFGESFHYVPYVECAIRGSKELAPECKTAGVKLFPSWQFGNEPPKEGVLTMDELSQKTGCKLP